MPAGMSEYDYDDIEELMGAGPSASWYQPKKGMEEFREMGNALMDVRNSIVGRKEDRSGHPNRSVDRRRFGL